MKKNIKSTLKHLADFRKLRSETQTEFWGRFGIGQSGGSRYEQGRNVPMPVQLLIALYAQGVITDAHLAQLHETIGSKTLSCRHQTDETARAVNM